MLLELLLLRSQVTAPGLQDPPDEHFESRKGAGSEGVYLFIATGTPLRQHEHFATTKAAANTVLALAAHKLDVRIGLVSRANLLVACRSCPTCRSKPSAVKQMNSVQLEVYVLL